NFVFALSGRAPTQISTVSTAVTRTEYAFRNRTSRCSLASMAIIPFTDYGSASLVIDPLEDPSDHGIQGQHRADDQPPRLGRGAGLVIGNVVTAVGTLRRVFVDFLAARWAGDGGFGVVFGLPVWPIVLPGFIAFDMARHLCVS